MKKNKKRMQKQLEKDMHQFKVDKSNNRGDVGKKLLMSVNQSTMTWIM